MSKRKLRQRVEDMHSRVGRVLQQSRHWGAYLDECTRGERSHRKWGGDFACYHSRALPIAVCARHFATRHVLQALLGTCPAPKAEDIFSLRLDWFQGYALATEYRDELTAALDLAEARAYLDEVDYCDLVGPVA